MEFQIKNILDQKLKKDYQVIIPKEIVNSRIDNHIDKIKSKVNLKGFRKGNVPANVVKEKYGNSILVEESEKLINEAIQQIIKNNEIKPALQPKVDVKKFEMDQDFEFNTTIEIYPEVPTIDLTKIKITYRKPEITEVDINNNLEKILKYHCKWESQPKDYKSKKGDAVNINYTGSIDGKEFEGGKAENYQLELGSNSFIDNFEDQLIGKKEGDQVKVKVKFPKDYHKVEFSGVSAVFDVKVNSVLTAKKPDLNDEFIKNTFGIESLDKLKEEIKKQLEERNNQTSKNIFKKELYDLLVKKYNFELPEGLIDIQFNSIWSEIEQEIKQNPNKFKNDKEKDKEKEKKKSIARRMVLSGLVLSEIAKEKKIEVTQDDINRELSKYMMNYPGQQKEILEYYQKNPQAVDQIRGVIVEEKTIDFIIENSAVDYKKISLKDLEKLWNKICEEE